MAIEKIVNIKVNTDATQASSDVNKLKSSIASATNEQGKLSDAMSGSKESGFINKLGDSLGQLSPAFGNASKGANTLITKMWLIVTNPLGAILIAIVGAATLLFKAFTSTKEGADQLSQVMAGLSSAVDVVRDRILNVGNAILKFFKGDFKGALNEGKKAVSGFGDEVASEFKKAANATKDLQQVEDSLNSLSVSRAKVNRDLAISKELLTDENASYAQKKKALDLIKTTEGKQTEQELANARKKFEAIKALNALSDTSREDKKKEQDAEAALFSLQEQSARDRRSINKQEKALLNQKISDEKAAAANLKTIADAKKAAAKEAYDLDKANLEEALKEEGLTFQKRRDLIKADRLLNDKDRRKYNAEVNKEEKQFIEAHRKTILDLEKQYITASEDAEDNTAQKRLDREMERKLQLIQIAENSEQERAKLTELWNKEYNRKQKEIDNNEIIEKQNKNLVLANNDKLNFDARLQAVMDRETAEKNIVFKSEDDKLAYEKANSDARIAIAAAEKKAKMDAFEGIASSLNGMADLLGNQTAVGKTMAVASATISTIMGAQSAYENALKIPYVGTVLAPINAGIAIAAGMKNVQSILAVKTPGGAAGGGTTSAVKPPSFNIVGQSGTNQLAQTIAGQQNKPIEAFVVSSAVTTSQALDRNRVRTATFGG